MDCNAATRNVPPCLCGGGVSGIPAAVSRDAWNEACWCLALYKSRRWNEAKEASEQRVEGTLINWRLKIEDWKFLRPVLKTRWRSNKRQSRAGSKRDAATRCSSLQKESNTRSLIYCHIDFINFTPDQTTRLLIPFIFTRTSESVQGSAFHLFETLIFYKSL